MKSKQEKETTKLLKPFKGQTIKKIDSPNGIIAFIFESGDSLIISTEMFAVGTEA